MWEYKSDFCENCGDPQHVYGCSKPEHVSKEDWAAMSDDERLDAEKALLPGDAGDGADNRRGA